MTYNENIIFNIAIRLWIYKLNQNKKKIKKIKIKKYIKIKIKKKYKK